MRQGGFSLLQLLFVTTTATLLSAIGVPSFFDLVQREKQASITNHIISILHFSRSEAITRNTPTVICPSRSGNACDGFWGSQLLIYRDSNYDNKFDEKQDTKLKHIELMLDWSINWRAFGNRKYIYYSAGSGEFNQNGTLELCPPDYREDINVIIINRIGRIRTETRKWATSKCKK